MFSEKPMKKIPSKLNVSILCISIATYPIPVFAQTNATSDTATTFVTSATTPASCRDGFWDLYNLYLLERKQSENSHQQSTIARIFSTRPTNVSDDAIADVRFTCADQDDDRTFKVTAHSLVAASTVKETPHEFSILDCSGTKLGSIVEELAEQSLLYSLQDVSGKMIAFIPPIDKDDPSLKIVDASQQNNVFVTAAPFDFWPDSNPATLQKGWIVDLTALKRNNPFKAEMALTAIAFHISKTKTTCHDEYLVTQEAQALEKQRQEAQWAERTALENRAIGIIIGSISGILAVLVGSFAAHLFYSNHKNRHRAAPLSNKLTSGV